MATYAELLGAYEDEALMKKIRVAVWVAADVVRGELDVTPNHAQRVKWAARALKEPDVEAQRIMRAVLAQNRGIALSAILTASDNAVQTAVNNALDLVALGDG